MPATLPAGTILTKTYNGTEHTVTALTDGFRYNGVRYPSLTAVAHAVRGDNQSVNGWDFFGVENPNRRARSQARATPHANNTDAQGHAIAKGKCKTAGCYEPADCHHGHCHTHCRSGHYLGSYSSRRYPTCSAPHIGVEVEVKYASSRDLNRGVTIECHADGSLGDYGAEYKVLAKATDAIATTTELVHELWKRRARVDRKCGMHVHIDVRQIDASRVREVMAWLFRTQETWFTMVPPSRRNNMYVTRLSSPTASSHYTWANTSPYNTIEIRIHGGTLNPYKVAGWLAALIHLQTKANEVGFAFPDTGDASADFWAVFANAPTEAREYLTARQTNGGVLRDNAFNSVEE